jgi:hypothetical protein
VADAFDPDEDLPTLDVRSPGERMADSGRMGFERVQQYLRPERLVSAAVAWMLGVTAMVVVQIWQSIALSRQFDDFPIDRLWLKLALLAQSGSLTVTLAILAGLALVVFSDPVRARVAAYLGVVLGLWTVVAGGVGIAVALHGGDNPFSGYLGANRFAEGLSFAASAVLGIVVTGFALALSRSGSETEVS